MKQCLFKCRCLYRNKMEMKQCPFKCRCPYRNTIFCNGNDDFSLKSVLTPIVKKFHTLIGVVIHETFPKKCPSQIFTAYRSNWKHFLGKFHV